MKFTSELRNDYLRLYKNVIIRKNKTKQVDAVVKRILKNKDRYVAVSKKTKVPWFMIAIIHNMESGSSFKHHLANGDSLSKRTRQVPKGRPVNGKPPFTWEESAIDALTYDRLTKWKDWSIAGCLYMLERFNGFGYRKHHKSVNSPYLWSYTNHYTKGKYIKDGKWSSTAVSQQTGAVSIIKELHMRNMISFGATNKVVKSKSEVITFADHKITLADELQMLLNKYDGNDITVDGWPGKNTAIAFKKMFGVHMKNDPKIKTVKSEVIARDTDDVKLKRNPTTIKSMDNNDPSWLKWMFGELGQREVKGSKNNARIIWYGKFVSYKITLDSIPWCASFQNAALINSGYEGTASAMARSFMNLDGAIKLKKPIRGCMVVFWRKSPKSSSGHIACYLGKKGNKDIIIGGNQSDSVSIISRSSDMVLGYYWPVKPLTASSLKKYKKYL